MECVLLGTGGMMPMPYRLLASMAVKLNGWIYIFDAGEGVQLGIKKVRLGVRGIRVIAVTHLHADHCLGLPGILMLKAQMEDPGPVTIIGPPGIERFVREMRQSLEFRLNYSLQFIEWREEAPETAYSDEQVRLLWHPLKHTRFCLGYRLEEMERPGRFDPQKALRLGVPRGPLWGRLQQSEKVVLETGKAVLPEQVLGPPRRGRHMAYVVDTRPAKGIYRLCHDADLAFIEGMFLPEHSEQADAKGHLTIVEAANISRRAGVRRTVLTHISPRYNEEDLNLLDAKLEEEAEGISVGRDFQTFAIPYPE